ncbi:MAG TPA: UbiA family prenyltransferase [Chloroflexia bacterium]|nr:UbiA family prenyltransferase [Chloroflexia bacterium]
MKTATISAYWRLLHPLPSIMTMLASGAFVVLAARGVPPVGTLALLLVIEACRQFSISAYNDYFDRHIDAKRPEKPVATGEIRPQVAWWIGAVFGLASLVLSVPLGLPLLALTAIGLAGGLLYDVGLKYTALSWLPFAVAFPTLPLWAWVGVHPDGDFPPRLWWVIPVGAVLALGIHMADTLPDLASDHEAGVRGVAHRLGMMRSVALCGGAFGVALVLTLALWPLLGYRLEWYLLGAVVGTALALASILLYLRGHVWQKTSSMLIEMGTLTLAVGWLGGLML